MSDTPTISIVDDDESFRESLAALLTAAGFEAQIFESATEFLETADLSFVDCLITDLQMPDLTGLELVDRLAASGRSVPSILISARYEETLRDQAMRAGVRGYLRKPFNEAELLSCIHEVLQERCRTQR